MKQVIHIYGASGSGTSTLGRALAGELGYAFFDTDDFFWMPTNPPFRVKCPPEERVEAIAKALAECENAVLSGAFTRWGDELIPLCTCFVRLSLEPALRLKRIEDREYARFGDRIREGGDMYETHKAFMEWAAAYDTAGPEQRSKISQDLWEEKHNLKVLKLNGADTLEYNISRIKNCIERS